MWPNWMPVLTVGALFSGVGVGLLGSQSLPLVGPPVPPTVEAPLAVDQVIHPPTDETPFAVDQVIHPLVAELPPPEFVDDIVSIPMAISSRSSLASRHVLQGLACIQAAWDFEAYRHFCEAVKEDPDCLMAYWGIGLSLAAPNNEFTRQRQIAVIRMIELTDATAVVNGKILPVASVMEQRYALALAELFALRGNARDAFKKLSEDYPNNLQAKCLAIYLQRDGFDDYGPKPRQEAAMRQMELVVEGNPDNVGVLSFWAMLHAEAPDATTKLREKILPLVRKVARKAPNFPPYQHLLGHFEWRCGNHYLAEAALSRASELYAGHMRKNVLSVHECDGWIRSQLYLATVMYSRGRFDEAMAIAGSLSSLEVDVARLGSTGANLLIWEAATLTARLYLVRGQQGDIEKAIASLPGKDDPFLKKIKDRSLSVFYLECLMRYLKCRKELESGNVDAAHKERMALDGTLLRMKGLRDQAMKSSSISEYVRAVGALEVYAAEVRGLIALARAATDSQRQIARSWFKTAVEKQQRPSLLMPPVVVSPMEIRLAEFHAGAGNFDQAAESYQAAIRRLPNGLVSLIGYRDSLIRIGRSDEAEEVDRVISAVKK